MPRDKVAEDTRLNAVLKEVRGSNDPEIDNDPPIGYDPEDEFLNARFEEVFRPNVSKISNDAEDIQAWHYGFKEQEETIAALRAAIAEKMAELKEIRERNEARSVQEESDKQQVKTAVEQNNQRKEEVVACGNREMNDHSSLSLEFSMFAETVPKSEANKPAENSCIGLRNRRGSESE